MTPEERTVKVQAIVDAITSKLERYFGCTIADAPPMQLYSACASLVRDDVMSRWMASRKADSTQHPKKLYYLSVEFLQGRALGNNLLSLDERELYAEALEKLGVSLTELEDVEPDPGLGNGGLGRLASCFMDSLATLDYSAMGCGIRYEYGLFKQCIINGAQVEVPDAWLEPFVDYYPWEVVRNDREYEIHFGGHVDETWSEDGKLTISHTGFSTVMAVPYDMPIVGYNTTNVSTLRLWSARSPKLIDMESFASGDYMSAVADRELAEIISKVLYPCENHIEGKSLRLKQHYFFTSATMQHILFHHKKTYGSDFSTLPQHVSIQINDTHPSLAIPELMRLLMDQEGLDWDSAWEIVTGVFNYTNHTVMIEALEKWPESLFKELLPRVYSIVMAINEKYCARLWNYYPEQWDKIARMAIVGYGEIRMANLCIAACANVNGVSQLHGEILKQELFNDFYVIEPWKFSGITNGITPRRWLLLSNPSLAKLLDEAIGTDYKTNLFELEKLVPLADDAAFREKFMAVKRENKVNFSNYLKRRQNIDIDPDTIFDAQAKRLHEYKRQIINVLNIIDLYDKLMTDPYFDIRPTTFIFGAKASANYVVAKQTIRLICSVRELIQRAPQRIRERLNVVFLENYSVTGAQALVPATDVSEQLSTAGKEASGTGNMKFMLNGAVTIGTMDGANVEMYEQVGADNIYIFGLSSAEAAALYRSGSYSAGHMYETMPRIRRVMDYMINGQLDFGVSGKFSELYHALLFGNGGMADAYLALKDFTSYSDVHQRLNSDYGTEAWAKKAVMNTAKSAVFSSDRTIEDYNARIWHLDKLRF